jgi:Mg2+/Co2+ transporter CorC
VQIANFRFEVVRADSRRIRLLSVKVLPPVAEETEA